ncbi:hypothetical protein BYT27DRAFT_7206946 [Phlegmacium glaucopus]|nr:hypothetical protein BYT27DRAFT_7206946 [Phlegmacium glaucopus]
MMSKEVGIFPVNSEILSHLIILKELRPELYLYFIQKNTTSSQSNEVQTTITQRKYSKLLRAVAKLDASSSLAVSILFFSLRKPGPACAPFPVCDFSQNGKVMCDRFLKQEIIFLQGMHREYENSIPEYRTEFDQNGTTEWIRTSASANRMEWNWKSEGLSRIIGEGN